jgi:ABC-2 type transport system permease protein
MNLRVIAAIARKDIVDAIRNRYLLIALVTPLFVALLFRFILPAVDNRLRTLTLVVHDSGGSSLVSGLRGMPQLKLIVASKTDGLTDEVQKNNAVAALDIPAEFDADLAGGRQPEVTVYLNTRKSGIEQAALRLLLEQQMLKLAKQPAPARTIWIDLARQPKSQTQSELNLNQMVLSVLLVMSLAMTGVLIVPLLVVEEKEKRTLDFLLTSPASLADIVAGKALTGLVYGLLSAAALLALNHNFVKNWVLTAVTTLLGLFLLVAIGLLMGSLFRNSIQVNTWAGFILFLLLMPSFVSGDFPILLKSALPLIPTYYFVDGLKLSLVGGDLHVILKDLVLTLVGCALAFSAATWVLRRSRN